MRMRRTRHENTDEARRLFLKSAVASAGSAALASCASGPATAADTVYVNGKIITADRGFSIAQAVAIASGRFIAVGSNDDILKFVGPNTLKVDLGGKTAIPGL